MINNVQRYVNFLCETGLTPDRFALLFLIYYDQAHRHEGESLCQKLGYFMREEYGLNVWLYEDIDALVHQGYLINHNTDDKLTISKLEVTRKFTDILIDHERFEEFWKAYPPFATKEGGGSMPLLGSGKDEAEKLYRDLVPYDMHDSVVAAVRWGTINGRINMRIDKFLKQRLYEPLIEEMRKDSDSPDQILGRIQRSGLDDQPVI